jgi:hypothetical protein
MKVISVQAVTDTPVSSDPWVLGGGWEEVAGVGRQQVLHCFHGVCCGLFLGQEPCDGLVQLCVVFCCFLAVCLSFWFWFSSVFPFVHVDLEFDSSFVAPLPQLCMGDACWGRSVRTHSMLLLPSLSSVLTAAGKLSVDQSGILCRTLVVIMLGNVIC